MTTHIPPICSFSSLSAWPGGSTSKVILLNTNGYPASDVLQNQTWEFVGGTPDWSNISPASVMDPNGPLPGRSASAMCSYDGTNVLLFGGNTQSAEGILGDTWTFSAGAWTKAAPATVPPARYKSAMAYLSGTGAVMFGGATSGESPLNDTWIYTSGNWSQVSVANGAGPGVRYGHCMAASSSQVLLFGGGGNQDLSHSLWSFASNTWTKSTPATLPSSRTGACMAYDATASLFVLFGGNNSAGVILNDTWTSPTGATWTQVVPANGAGPSGRIGAQMAYDAVSGSVIMFGGVSSTIDEADAQTWKLVSGTTWSQL